MLLRWEPAGNAFLEQHAEGSATRGLSGQQEQQVGRCEAQQLRPVRAGSGREEVCPQRASGAGPGRVGRTPLESYSEHSGSLWRVLSRSGILRLRFYRLPWLLWESGWRIMGGGKQGDQ